jgi:Mg2+/Co2+ transporter CorB
LDASGSSLTYLVFILLLLLSAAVSAAETALLAANRLRLQQLEDAGDGRARTALRLLQEPGRLLTTLLVADNAINVLATVLATSVLIAVFGFDRGVLYAAVGVVLLLLVVGEILPKRLAATHADRLALLFARPLAAFGTVLSPVVGLLSAVGSFVARPLGAGSTWRPRWSPRKRSASWSRWAKKRGSSRKPNGR